MFKNIQLSFGCSWSWVFQASTHHSVDIPHFPAAAALLTSASLFNVNIAASGELSKVRKSYTQQWEPVSCTPHSIYIIIMIPFALGILRSTQR